MTPKKHHILVVDDEEAIRTSLKGALKDEGYAVSVAAEGRECYEKLEKDFPDLVLLDIWMPEIDGLEVLETVKNKYSSLPIIIMTGHGNIETAVKATKLGAYDFVEKPISLDKIILLIDNAISASRLKEENRYFKEQADERYKMVGDSVPMKKLTQQIDLAAPVNSWILISGENGTGKELVARAIHQKSNRAEKPFVDVNCAAIPEELIESELFGHEKGAFTGAVAMKKGKFDIADNGTLFLDEIADMSLKTQAKVLRILQEQRYERVGGTKSLQVDVRVIAATNKNLFEEMKSGNFREDLYYRLNVIPFRVPALRERKEDIPVLSDYFLELLSKETCKPRKILMQETKGLLKNYSWPGNVRELKNLIEMITILSPNEEIYPENIPDYIRVNRDEIQNDFTNFETLKDARQDFEKQFIVYKLEQFEGNISRTAEAIGIERSNLHKKIKAYGIDI